MGKTFGTPTQAEVDKYYDPKRQGVGYYANNQVDTVAVRNSTAEEWNHGISRQILDPDEYSYNPKFDPRSTVRGDVGRMASFGVHKLTRGRVTNWDVEDHAPADGTRLRNRSVNFLYNPSEISSNYSFSMEQAPADSYDASTNDIAIYAANTQSISWTLYFNRTYEVATHPEHMGVAADIQALEYLAGTWDGKGLQARQLLVVFGATRKLKPFAFSGWMSNMDVTYMRFSHQMIPTVAMVQLGLYRRISDESLGGSHLAWSEQGLNHPLVNADAVGNHPTHGFPADDSGLSDAPPKPAPRTTTRGGSPDGRVGGAPL